MAVTHLDTQTYTASESMTYSVPAGSARLLVVRVGVRLVDITEVTVSVTVDAQAMTEVISQRSGRAVSSLHYGKDNLLPTSGNVDIVITIVGDAINSRVHGISTYGTVDQNTPITDSDSDISDAPSVTLTSATDEICTDQLVVRGDQAIAESGDQTITRYDVFSGDCESGCADAPGAASVTMSWDDGAASNTAYCAMALKEGVVIDAAQIIRRPSPLLRM